VTGYSWDSAGECSFSGIENGVITCQTTQLSLIDTEPDKDVRGKLSQKKVKTMNILNTRSYGILFKFRLMHLCGTWPQF